MHVSVLLKESIAGLNLNQNSIVIDATLGRAGHSKEILKIIKNGFLYAFDQDADAIRDSLNNIKEFNNYELINKNFVTMKEEMFKRNVLSVDAILFDLGVSSPQLDNKERGFSFHGDARLDMRMDKNRELSAYEVVNNYPYKDLVRIFKVYGEEKYASSIASNIERVRKVSPIETTMELVDVIKASVPEKYKREHHPARKIFQAIRIEVNNELEILEQSLKDALDLIKVNGRISVITFHSLEDKICKKIFKEVSTVDSNLTKLPIIPEEYQPKFKVVGVIEPSREELELNNRARSAKLRIIERIK